MVLEGGKSYHVISCQPTPGGILARKLTESLNSNPDRKILVTEDGEIPVSASLRKADPFRNPKCRFNDPDCMVEGSKDCAKSGVIYEITCILCNTESDDPGPQSRNPGSCQTYNYIGMTRTSCHWRMVSHLQGQRSQSESNPLHRHDTTHHGGVKQKYQTRILACERNLLPLRILEGLYIEKQNKLLSMNDRNENGRGSLIRLTASRV